MRIDLIVGARPNFMKAAPVYGELKKVPGRFSVRLIHTGQHYDDKMSRIFFQELNLPHPDIYLGVGSGTHGVQTAKVMMAYEEALLKDGENKPDLVLVVGDVNSTLACSLAAVKLHIKVAHIEAGLRSFDWEMPEEINRLVTDTVSDLLFTTCEDADQNLLKEGHSPDQIHRVGNVMIDSLLEYLPLTDRSTILEKLGVQPKGYALVTLHRPANVDVEGQLGDFLDAFAEIQTEIPIIFPAHPRTQKMIRKFRISQARTKNLKITDPLGYLDFIKLEANSRFVMTDSGGMQEETTVMGIPCLTLRKNTERPVTIRVGTNTLVGVNREDIVREARKILSGRGKKGKVPEFWEGRAAERIAKVIMSINPKI
ncbi:UDP-N-acetylglucosamine 2-epimerase (non-hydrolyzing) [candidate division KSB1 bacterium]|nr:UDP-N-acetylglucosamine 2-epimerase (non-hydrolyzing) [candidate division KSB1 bacterium]